MKKLKGFAKEFGVSILSLALPIMASAQGGGQPATPNPAGTGSNVAAIPTAGFSTVQGVLDFLCVILGWLFYFLIALAVIFIIIAAYKYLTSGGNAEKTKGANSTILYAAIAVAVALLAKAIPLIVADFLGANNLGHITIC